MNLGVVCSDQERFNRSDRLLRASPACAGSNAWQPPARIGALYNNLAGCYRKMARFDDAHQAIERSIGILTQLGRLGRKTAICRSRLWEPRG